MFSYAECALMADAVYHAKEEPHYSSIVELAKAGCVLSGVFEKPGPLYRGAIWRRGGATAFVVRGTMPLGGYGQNLGQDFMMKMASQAPYGLVKAAVQDISRTINPPLGAGMFVGHSLGGSAAQVLGLLYGLPFMTFNAPGMRYDLMRKAWVRHTMIAGDTLAVVAGKLWGLLPTVATMVPFGRDLANTYVKHTQVLDQDYDHARSEMAHQLGIPMPDATAALSPDYQLGYNIAHHLDEIHQLMGPPVGTPWRYADWTPSLFGAAAAAACGPYDIYFYHDSKKLADYIAKQAWGAVHPVKSYLAAKGRIYYYKTH